MKSNKPWLMAALFILPSLLAVACTAPQGAESPVASPVAAEQHSFQEMTSQTTDLVKTIEPAVVRIDVDTSKALTSGSAFIVDSRGYMFTSQHVIDDAIEITATLMNGDVYAATMLDSDASRDVAVLKIVSDRTDFPVVPLGSSADAAVGEDVIAAGFPLGTQLPGPATFTRGIISAVRTLNELNYIQSDVTINSGNSGGCLLSLLQGKVVGIISAVIPTPESAKNIGLAVPIDEVKAYFQRIITK